MSALRRAASFAAEFAREVRFAWERAVMHDCENHGGHRMGAWRTDEFTGLHRVCERCGYVKASIFRTHFTPTTTATSSNYTVTYSDCSFDDGAGS